MKPLDLTNEDQTLHIMDIWLSGCKMDAAKEYNGLIIDKLADTFNNTYEPKQDKNRIFSCYKILQSYFSSI